MFLSGRTRAVGVWIMEKGLVSVCWTRPIFYLEPNWLRYFSIQVLWYDENVFGADFHGWLCFGNVHIIPLWTGHQVAGVDIRASGKSADTLYWVTLDRISPEEISLYRLQDRGCEIVAFDNHMTTTWVDFEQEDWTSVREESRHTVATARKD